MRFNNQTTFMLPKTKTIRELYEGHPERWTQRAMFWDESLGKVEHMTSCAVSCCLLGAIKWVYPNNSVGVRNKILDKVNMATVVCFNDAKSTTFDDVLKLVTELNI